MKIVGDDGSGRGDDFRTFSVKYRINVFEGSRQRDPGRRESQARVEKSQQSQDLSDCDILVAGKADHRPIDAIRLENKKLREKVRYYRKSRQEVNRIRGMQRNYL